MPARHISTAAANAQSVAFGAHEKGDLLVVGCYINSNGTVNKPAAGGTVPNYVDEIHSSTSNGSWRIAAAVATSNNHTTGTWGTAAASHIFATVIRGQAATYSGGTATTDATTGQLVTAPAVAMPKADGGDVLLHYHGTLSVATGAWLAAPTGYTRQGAVTTGAAQRGACLNTKDVTTSDGAVDQGNTSAGFGKRGATVLILGKVDIPKQLNQAVSRANLR